MLPQIESRCAKWRTWGGPLWAVRNRRRCRTWREERERERDPHSDEMNDPPTTIVRVFLALIPRWDYSLVRPAQLLVMAITTLMLINT